MIPCTAMFAATSPSVNCRKAIGGRQQQAICVVTALSQSLLVTDHMVDWMLGLLCHNQLAADSGWPRLYPDYTGVAETPDDTSFSRVSQWSKATTLQALHNGQEFCLNRVSINPRDLQSETWEWDFPGINIPAELICTPMYCSASVSVNNTGDHALTVHSVHTVTWETTLSKIKIMPIWCRDLYSAGRGETAS